MKAKLSRNVAKAVLQKEGRIFGATYVKKNGEITKINGRFGVHKFLRGGRASSPNVWTVWDNNRKRYTALIPENIQTIRYGGYEYEMK